MATFLDAFLGLTAGEDVVLRVTVSLLILVLGHLAVKLLSTGIRRVWIDEEMGRKQAEERSEAVRYLSYILDAAVIVFTLLYLNTGLTSRITAEFVAFLPSLFSVMLIGVLGFIGINLFAKISTEFLKRVGVSSYFRELGLSGNTLDVVSGIVKGFLYLLLLQISFQQIGIGDTFLNELVTASSWAFAFLVAALIFYGFKDLFQNFASGVYLKNSRMVRPGEKVRLEEETGEVRELSLFSTTVDTESGYTLLKPNTEIMKSDLKFKRTKNDIETLEEIKDYFVSTDASSSAAAVIEIALDVFGYRKSQQSVAEKAGEDPGPEELEDAVEELTNMKVRSGFVERDKITDLGDELKAWFNDGALAAPVFDKSEMFHDAEGADYVLAIGVEHDEVLAVDPGPETGGVYFIDKSEMVRSMEEDGGYMVLAPEGTNAYWRIEKELLYSDKNYYDELSKTLEARLTKIMRQGRILSDVMPSSVRDYIEDWRSERYVSRLWKPEEGEEDEASESDGN